VSSPRRTATTAVGVKLDLNATGELAERRLDARDLSVTAADE
jgi:hypothetical protein